MPAIVSLSIVHNGTTTTINAEVDDKTATGWIKGVAQVLLNRANANDAATPTPPVAGRATPGNADAKTAEAAAAEPDAVPQSTE